MDTEQTHPPRNTIQPEADRRRAVDEKFDEITRRLLIGDVNMKAQSEATQVLQNNVEGLKRDMAENTRATKESGDTITEVKNILTTFKTLGTFAKWLSGLVAALAAAWAAVKGLRG